MVFCLVHLDDARGRAAGEEVHLFVPDTSRTVIVVPLDALPAFLPLLDEAVGDRPPSPCSDCAATLTERAEFPDPHRAPAYLG